MTMNLNATHNCSAKKDTAITGRINYTVRETISQALEKQISNVVKAVRYTAFYVGQSMEHVPVGLNEFSKQLGNFKNILSTRKLYDDIPKACNSLCAAVASRSYQVARTALLDCGTVCNAVADTVEVTNVFAPLNPVICNIIKSVNVWVTGTCATLNSITQIDAFLKAADDNQVEQQMLSLLKLAMNVSYAAFAVIMLTVAAPTALAIVTTLASGTAFGLLSFFYENINDPYGKNYEAYKKLEGRVQLAS
jgi:hypothetical protein